MGVTMHGDLLREAWGHAPHSFENVHEAIHAMSHSYDANFYNF